MVWVVYLYTLPVFGRSGRLWAAWGIRATRGHIPAERVKISGVVVVKIGISKSRKNRVQNQDENCPGVFVRVAARGISKVVKVAKVAKVVKVVKPPESLGGF